MHSFYGVLVLVWQDGYGSQAIRGLPATGAITAWIPLFVFAFLYGLSMDYEVFLLSRMREEYDRAGSTAQVSASSAVPLWSLLVPICMGG